MNIYVCIIRENIIRIKVHQFIVLKGKKIITDSKCFLTQMDYRLNILIIIYLCYSIEIYLN
jgi:hypothetical protein